MREILLLLMCFITTLGIPIRIYKNARFDPRNSSLKLMELSSINSRDDCACQCLINSSCYTAEYVGVNQTCSLFNAKVRVNWLRRMGNATQASVLTFANESFPGLTRDFQQPPTTYSTGAGPLAMMSVDFNHDDHLDLIIGNQNGNSISVLLGFGNGSFRTPPINTNSNGSTPYWFVSEDFNHDGDLDIAICHEASHSISILYGKNNGSFQSTIYSFFSGGQFPSSMITIDVNHDSQPDLAVTNTASDIITVFLGFADGTFQIPGMSYAAGSRPSSLCSDDFNNDGHVDLAVVSRLSNGLLIFLGIGNGLFQTNYTLYSTDTLPYVVRTGDFNNDSKADLVVGSFTSSTIKIYLGTGLGTFTFSPFRTYSSGIASPIDIAIADLNRDAMMDLAISNQGGT